MKFLIQVVQNASVAVENDVIGSIGRGLLIFMGACDADDYEIADKMIQKCVNLRIFSDENGKTNLSINDINGQVLVVSQFTLYADCRKGNRPSFFKSGSPEHANQLYEYIIDEMKNKFGLTVEHGKFGADMKVSIVNDGPFTILLDSNELFQK